MAEILADQIGRYSSVYAFTAAEGGPVHHPNFRRRHFLSAVKGVNESSTRPTVPVGVRWHDLRHTCAALVAANGQHMAQAKEYLGHSSIRVTSDRYAHLFPRARSTMADALDTTFANTRIANPADFSRTTPAITHLPGRERAAQ